MATITMDAPALLRGEKAVSDSTPEIFAWPIITDEDEAAVLEVLRRGAMSGTDVTQKFEEEYAAWQGNEFALGFCNGTAAVQAAMFGVGVGRGDEVICPSITYWASALPAFTLGATLVFCDLDPSTLCLDPNDIERHITNKTKAIVVVHYLGHPADMDAICAVAKKRDLKIIEDVSHAQGGLYKGRKLGTFGDVSGISLMSGKSLASGEGGILTTDTREIYERAIAWGHYDRFTENIIRSEALKPLCGLPLGGIKGRMHQLSSAVARVQLKYYDERCEEIRKAMNYFWDLLEGVRGIRAHRVDESSQSNMAGWYAPHGLYVPEELGGLSVGRFAKAICAEGSLCMAGCNAPLHTHPVLNEADIYHDGQPTRNAFTKRDVRQESSTLQVASNINERTYSIPHFKKFRPEIIEQHAAAYRKVCKNYEFLIEGDTHQAVEGRAGLSAR